MDIVDIHIHCTMLAYHPPIVVVVVAVAVAIAMIEAELIVADVMAAVEMELVALVVDIVGHKCRMVVHDYSLDTDFGHQRHNLDDDSYCACSVDSDTSGHYCCVHGDGHHAHRLVRHRNYLHDSHRLRTEFLFIFIFSICRQIKHETERNERKR